MMRMISNISKKISTISKAKISLGPLVGCNEQDSLPTTPESESRVSLCENRYLNLDITEATARNPLATSNESKRPSTTLNEMVIILKARRCLLVQYGLRPTLPINLPPSGRIRSTRIVLFVAIRRRRTRTQFAPRTWNLQLTKKSKVAFPVHLLTWTPPRRRR